MDALGAMESSRNRISYLKQAFYVACITVALLIGLFTYFGPGGYREMKRIQAELAIHQQRVEALRVSNEERLHRIQRLRDDPQAIETYARKKGYGRKGEIIEEVPEPVTPDVPAPDANATTTKK